MIIGISGKKQHGKDTVAKMIQFHIMQHKLKERGLKLFDLGPQSSTDSLFHYNIWDRWNDKQRSIYSGWERKPFAEKLKQIVCLLINCTMEQLEDNAFKNKELGEEWRVWNVWSPRLQKYISNPVLTKTEVDIEIRGKFWQAEDELVAQNYILTPRLMLQLIGTEGGRIIIHPNIWINARFSDYTITHKKGEPIPMRGDALKDDRGYYIRNRTGQYKTPDDLLLPEKLRGAWIDQPNYIYYVNAEEDTYPDWIIPDVRFPNECQAIKDRGGLLLRVVNPNVVSTDTHPSETSLDHYEDEMWDGLVINDAGFDKLLFEVEYFLDSHQTKLGL